MHTSMPFVRGLTVCAGLVVLGCAVSVAPASTIIKLNLGESGPDLAMNALGQLSTAPDGNAGTTGDQNTAVEYTTFLDFIPDIPTNTASFSLANVTAVGPAHIFGTVVLQNFSGGSFSLYDPANTLLLQGPLINSTLSGTLGPPGTGSLFSTTLSTVTGGTLAPFIAPGTVSLSFEMTNVNGGAGFAVAPGGAGLLPFFADSSAAIAANPVPEPVTCGMMVIAGAALMLRRVRD